jgi:hypothetical protein
VKNPECKPLRIVHEDSGIVDHRHEYGRMLGQLAVAEATLVAAGKDSALPHFIAVVKELERVYEFRFEVMEE